MEYRTLGRTGCAVSHLALGTMTFGQETDEAGAHAQLDRYADAGGNLIDTADVYAGTVSEEIVGRWLADRPARVRDAMVVATKGRFPTGGDVNDHGLSARHLGRALDASLSRLGIDTIDLYQVHSWDPVTPVERPSGSSTTRSGPARSATSACPTTPAGSCRRWWAWRSCAAGSRP